jgi:cell division protein DivIC
MNNNSARSNVLPIAKGQDQVVQQAQPGKQAGRKRRFKVRNLVLTGFALWAAYVFLFVQSPNIERLEEEQQRLGAEIQQTQQINSDLEKKIEQLQDPNYIAEVARKKYMMIKPGETLFMESKQ